MTNAKSITSKNREWGDFQTPENLASKICTYLRDNGVSPQIVVEPTYGIGNFIWAALETFSEIEMVYGVEIKAEYEPTFKARLSRRLSSSTKPSLQLRLFQDDIFRHKFEIQATEMANKEILIIGNPPWITNAELGSLASSNLPGKSNFKAAAGLEALTGKANFDVAEWIILKMLELFSEYKGTLAMLCKNSVIRNIMEILPRYRFKVATISALAIDAKAEFGAAVDASLLMITLGKSSNNTFICKYTTLDNPANLVNSFGWVKNHFVSNIETYQRFGELEGTFPFEWRQGLKHDCAGVMEVNYVENTLCNPQGQKVDVEAERIYPLLKSSDLKNFEITNVRKKVIVPQSRLGEDTSTLRLTAPKLWSYLEAHKEQLDNRKSSIYRQQPRFSIFGIGDYSFKLYKVAISGLYKKPLFSLVLPFENCPVMLDDTCYFLGFDNYLEALFTATLLNSRPVQQFLECIVFLDAKRPYKKEVLVRINLAKAAIKSSFNDLQNIWKDFNYIPHQTITEMDYQHYITGCLLKQNLPLQFAFSW